MVYCLIGAQGVTESGPKFDGMLQGWDFRKEGLRLRFFFGRSWNSSRVWKIGFGNWVLME